MRKTKNTVRYMLAFCFLSIFIYNGNLFAQANLIKNPGFEDPGTPGNYPDGFGQADRLSDWISHIQFQDGCISGCLLWHSPDWKSDLGTNQGIQALHNIPERTGTGSLGMGSYELIQQRFRSEEMEPGNTYYFSCYIWLPTDDVTLFSGEVDKLRVYVARNEINYQVEDGLIFIQCGDDYCSFQDGPLQDIDEIGNFDITPANYAPGIWHRVEFSWVAPNNIHEFDYIGIELTTGDEFQAGTDQCWENGGYLAIDDVRFTDVQYCDNPCSPDLDPVTHTTIPNAMVGTQAPWYFNVENATGIEFQLWDQWGANIYTQRAEDANGLADPGYSDYQFVWVGEYSDGTMPSQDDVFPYTLKLWNCDHEIRIEGSITYLVGDDLNDPIPDTNDPELDECCPDELYIQNIQYFGELLETSEVFIKAGNAVTTGTNGPVTINAGAIVRFVSPTIELHDGFSVDPDGYFEAVNEMCSNYHLRSAAPPSKKRFALQPEFSYDELKIKPTPANNYFEVSSGNITDNIEKLMIYDVTGRLITTKTYDNVANKRIVNCSELDNGTYLIKANFKNKQWSGKAMVKH